MPQDAVNAPLALHFCADLPRGRYLGKAGVRIDLIPISEAELKLDVNEISLSVLSALSPILQEPK